MEYIAQLGLMWKIAIIALLHWAFVPIALRNVAAREHVLGGHKVLWVMTIMFITCFGALFYLMLHPAPQNKLQTQRAQREYDDL